ncbi:MAG: chromate resistance protein [Gemmatimonadetes bacterium]|nr:chromate resistance protein [Gemmatimonadota bacterium]
MEHGELTGSFQPDSAIFNPTDRGLEALAEIIHDIDCKDGEFGRAEAAGIESLIHGITRAHADDEVRLERGGALLDDLYEHLGAPSR